MQRQSTLKVWTIQTKSKSLVSLDLLAFVKSIYFSFKVDICLNAFDLKFENFLYQYNKMITFTSI